jgi:hypothetical protein
VLIRTAGGVAVIEICNRFNLIISRPPPNLGVTK